MYGERCFLIHDFYLFKTVFLMFFLQYETHILYFMINFENIWFKVFIELWCVILKIILLCISHNAEYVFT